MDIQKPLLDFETHIDNMSDEDVLHSIELDQKNSMDEPINTSHWINVVGEGYNWDVVHCAKCNGEAKYHSDYIPVYDENIYGDTEIIFYDEEREYELTPYCPYCGAKMIK